MLPLPISSFLKRSARLFSSHRVSLSRSLRRLARVFPSRSPSLSHSRSHAHVRDLQSSFLSLLYPSALSAVTTLAPFLPVPSSRVRAGSFVLSLSSTLSRSLPRHPQRRLSRAAPTNARGPRTTPFLAFYFGESRLFRCKTRRFLLP